MIHYRLKPKETKNMAPTPKEIEKLIDDIDAKIEYYQGLRKYATKEIGKLLDTKGELLDTYQRE